MIQRLDTLRRGLIWDIIKTIGLVIITIPVWLGFNINKYASSAAYYDNYNYIETEMLNNPSYKLENMSDTEGLAFVETKDIIVSNYSNTLDSYYLLLESNDNSDNVRININNIVNDLNEYESTIIDGNTYFILDRNDLVSSSQKYNISLWKCEGADIDANFNYSIIVKDSI